MVAELRRSCGDLPDYRAECERKLCQFVLSDDEQEVGEQTKQKEIEAHEASRHQ